MFHFCVILILGTQTLKRKRKQARDEPEQDVGYLWQDEEFKSLKLRKYQADLDEQELRKNLIEEQTKLFAEQTEESRKRQRLLDLQADLIRRQIASLDTKCLMEGKIYDNSIDD